jgi:hypothetical protein
VGGGSETFYFLQEFYRSCSARQCPLVLLLKVCWLHGRQKGSKEGKVMGSGLFGGKELSIWTDFVLWGCIMIRCTCQLPAVCGDITAVARHIYSAL